MIVIAGTATLKPEAVADALAAARQMGAASRAEPGCRTYRFSTDLDDPTTVHLFEEWDDQAALDAHFATVHFREFAAAFRDAVAAPGSFTRYEVASSGPLFG